MARVLHNLLSPAGCRVCHARFYGDTIEEARAACLEHAREDHPDWGIGACYCPD